MTGGAGRNKGASWVGIWLGEWENVDGDVDNLHKRVVDRDHKHLTGVLQRRVVDVAGHVGAGARRACGSVGSLVSYRHRYMAAYHGCGNIWKRTEGSWDTNDNTLALKLLGDVDLVAGRGLDEINAWDGVANLNTGACR